MFDLKALPTLRRMWMKMANIPEARRGWLLEDCDEVPADVISRIHKWMSVLNDGQVIRASGSKQCGRGLLLWGEPGHGKTTLALSVIQEIMMTFKLDPFKVEEGHVLLRPCYFSTFNDILDLKGKSMDNEMTDDEHMIYQGILGECENDAYNIRVLVIDDLGKEHTGANAANSGPVAWRSSLFHHILRTRFNHGLSTIVTTNIKLDNWGAAFGDATESFAQEAFYYLPIITTDLRK